MSEAIEIPPHATTLALLQNKIFQMTRTGQLDGAFVRRCLVRLLHGLSSPGDTAQKLELGELNQMLFEAWQVFIIDDQDDLLIIEAHENILKEGRKLIATRFDDQMIDDLEGLERAHPAADAAHKLLPELIAATTRPRHYAHWLERLSAVHPDWNHEDLRCAEALAGNLERYARLRKQSACKLKKQMEVAGFIPGDQLSAGVQQQATYEGSMHSAAFEFWEYLTRAAAKQHKDRAATA